MLTPERPDFTQLRIDFMLHFGNTNEPIHLFMAPGRINLIGEHTDYNGGFVMPAALTLGSYLLIRKRNDDVIRLAIFRHEIHGNHGKLQTGASLHEQHLVVVGDAHDLAQ